MTNFTSQRYIIFLYLSITIVLVNKVQVLAQCATSSFNVAQNFSVGNGPHAIANGDFNGDGHNDVATANFFDNRVSVILGNGVGGFGAPLIVTVGTMPRAIASGDFNNDAKADLVVVNFGSNNISVLLGDGSGGFFISELAGGNNPRSVVVADFNNDNKPDFAVANQSNSLSIFMGDGAGAFASSSIPIDGIPAFVTTGELNHDNKSDLIVATIETRNVRVLLGNGNGTFAAPTAFSAGFDAAVLGVADFNGDTHADIAVGSQGGTVSVMLGSGNGALGSPVVVYQSSTEITSLMVADLNSDGKADLILTDRTVDIVSVHLGTGTGSFNSPNYSGVGNAPYALAVSDLNHDAKLDLVVANLGSDNVTVLSGDGAGTFRQNVFYDAGRGPESLVVGDFNNDGHPDVAVAGYFHVSVFINGGTGRFPSSQSISLSGSPAGIATADFNNDGNLDLVTADQATNKITILQGSPSGTFSKAGNPNAGFNPVSVTVGDFNTDGNADVAVANSFGNAISILMGDGLGGFAVPVGYSAGSSPRFINAADLNNDGKYDLIVANLESDDLSLYLGNGTGTFNSMVNLSVGHWPVSVAVDDLNGDGNNDIAVGHAIPSSNLSVLIGNGQGGFSPSNSYTVGVNPRSVVIGDVNGDNKLDLAVADYNSATTGILLNAGNGTFGSPTNLPIAGANSSAGLGDFDGDGVTDLALTTEVSSFAALVILKNTCANLPTPPPKFFINDVTVSEIDTAGVNATLTVSLSHSSNQTVSVSYALISGTAKRNTDFQSIGGRLVFAPGELTRSITVPIVGDTIDEFDETYNVLIHQALNASVGDKSGLATINDNDPPPTISLSDVLVLEGDSSSRVVNLLATLSMVSEKPISVQFTLQGQTATADIDYVAASGTLEIPAGTLSVNLPVTLKGDAGLEDDETLLATFSTPNNVTIVDGQGQITILNDDAELRFSALSYSVDEGVGNINISIERLGYLNRVIEVNYATTDTDNFTVNCGNVAGNAFARCDFATSVDTLTFAAGETSKTFAIPIINDLIAEGNETFGVTLNNVIDATLGSPATATVTITDNETVTGPNPIFATPFFVRQHYLDFLSREPEPTEPWSAVLNGCSDVNNNPACDRLTVSGAFFGSPEFSLKGLFAYRFYKLAFNRLPLYSEIVVDMRTVTGTTPAETFQKKATFTNNFVQRTEFLNLYNGLSNLQYVNTLMGRYSLTSIRTPDPANPDGAAKATLSSLTLTNRLNGIGGALTRAQVLRAIADSDEVASAEANQGFVAMQYYGYLRRTPDTAGFNSWINHLNANPTDFRTMVNGFMNSAEYRLRFGPQN